MNGHSNELLEESIPCMICNEKKIQCEIIELNCNHIFCWACIQKYLQKNSDIKVKCPEVSCKEFLTDLEKRKVLSDDEIKKYEEKCLRSICNNHSCLLPSCRTIVLYDDPSTQYNCSVCTLYNCVSCKAAHAGYLCSGFQSLSSQDKKKCCQAEMKRAKRIYEKKEMNNIREDMLSIEQISIVNSDCIFECDLCGRCVGKEDGVVLKNCGCRSCKPCLTEFILSSTNIPKMCPMCDMEEIYEEEISNILSPEQLSTYKEMCISVAENKLDSHCRCQAVDCGVLHHTKVTTTSFTCATCKALNCVKCIAVHINETCEQYKVRMLSDKNSLYIEEHIKQGTVWFCIVCKTLLRKVSGCNWIQCPSCNTELCWIRKMRRWGPGGRGDISGGCRCGVDGIPCHVDCKTSCTPHDTTNNFYNFTNQTRLPLFMPNIEYTRQSNQRIFRYREIVRPSNQRNAPNMESVRPSNQRIAQNMESVRPSNQTNSQNEESWCNIL